MRARPTYRDRRNEAQVGQEEARKASFAAAVDREEVRRGAEELGVDFDEHVAFVIAAMADRAEELGLGPRRRRLSASVRRLSPRPQGGRPSRSRPVSGARPGGGQQQADLAERLSAVRTAVHLRRHVSRLVEAALLPSRAPDHPREQVLQPAEGRPPRSRVLAQAVAVVRLDGSGAPGAPHDSARDRWRRFPGLSIRLLPTGSPAALLAGSRRWRRRRKRRSVAGGRASLRPRGRSP